VIPAFRVGISLRFCPVAIARWLQQRAASGEVSAFGSNYAGTERFYTKGNFAATFERPSIRWYFHYPRKGMGTPSYGSLGGESQFFHSQSGQILKTFVARGPS
jgi:hypothetical protein